MMGDDELDMLLGEIPRAASSLSLREILNNSHHHLLHNNHVDHGYGHAERMNGHGHGQTQGNNVHVKYACASSPVSGFSLQSDGSSSFSGGGRSLSDIGSSSPIQFENLKPHLISGNGFCLDCQKDGETNLADYMNLSRSLSKMYISGEQKGVLMSANDYQYCDQSLIGATRMGFDRYRASDNYMKDLSYGQGFNPSFLRKSMNFEEEFSPALVRMRQDQGMANSSGSQYSPSQSDRLICLSDLGNSALSPQFNGNIGMGDNNLPMGFLAPNVFSSLDTPSVGDSLFYPSRNGVNLIEARNSFYSPNMVQFPQLPPHYTEESLVHYQPPLPNGRNTVPYRVPQRGVEAFTDQDSLIIQGRGINYEIPRHARHNTKSSHHELSGANKTQEKRPQLIHGHLHNAGVQESPVMYPPYILASKCNSISEAQGHIYHLAKDQHGCRYLQRIFDVGTSLDVQIIFNEIIDHAVELMMNPFGNYLMQKLLEVCDEEQRMHILLALTREPGELVRISLNTHGTRVVQKLVETLKTEQQISLVISALESGFLALIKDLNGNHVIQRCLACFSSEDNKFIFGAAAKYCVDIATHRHGCCVLQRCISHSTGEHRQNLVAQISANGLLLAQDAFGNYVVQCVLELRIPFATSKLISQFEGNYVHLATQKFSSHVVEKCLVVCSDEARSKIVHELLSATYFDQLLQDPHANYVIQTALNVSEGHLNSLLVEAIESHKALSRNSPYSKRIFTNKLLKK